MEPASNAPCLVCREPVVTNTVRCERCGVPYHADCLAYAGRCAVFACDPPPPQPVKGKRRRWRDTPLWLQLSLMPAGILPIAMFGLVFFLVQPFSSGTTITPLPAPAASPRASAIAPRPPAPAASATPSAPAAAPRRRPAQFAARIPIPKGTWIRNERSALTFARLARESERCSRGAPIESLDDLVGRIATVDIPAGCRLDTGNLILIGPRR